MEGRNAGKVVDEPGRVWRLCCLVREVGDVQLEGKLLEGKVVVEVRFADLEIGLEYWCHSDYADDRPRRPGPTSGWRETGCSVVENAVRYDASLLLVS